MPQPLNSKEASLFRSVVKNYESKQYKKGIKAADQVLRKVPNHGDTQAMKALILNTTGSTDEAFALAKKALKDDMKSHVCWHVYGLLYRSQKNYEEAIKAYNWALRLEPESPQILRDLSLLQVQTRDFEAYVNSRHKMLLKREGLRQNWTALAIAHHLNGNLEEAEHVLDLYENTIQGEVSIRDVEHNEALMYRNTIIEERGDIDRALEHLDSIDKRTLDRTAIMERRAAFLLRLKRFKDAEDAYRALLERNNELRAYYDGLEQALEFDKKDLQKRKQMYDEIAEKDAGCDAARRMPLDFLEGEAFREAAGSYLRRMLRKGVPSTFNNVKSLYANPAKRQTIQDLVESYKDEKQQVNGDTSNHDDSSSRWEQSILYFLAQHYNYYLTRDLNKAMTYINRLIELDPKTYDWHMTKARIFKHLGQPAEAAKHMNIAREIDLRDRWINCKCAKYQLRNNESNVALNTMSKFTRNEVMGGTLGDLIEMQALWYLTEDGEAYARQARYGLALKRFHTIFNIFDTWQEDQFDFHTFSLRKAQIRAYVDTLRWEDRLRSHPYYTRAALDAINIYLALHDNPQLASYADLPLSLNAAGSHDSKTIQKARKEEEMALSKQSEADRKAAAKKANMGQDGELKKTDDDPKGLKLAQTKQPLDEAMRFLVPLLEFGDGDMAVQLTAFEVFLRRGKLFRALKHLLLAVQINKDDPRLHACFVAFWTKVQKKDVLTPQVKELAGHLPPPYDSETDLKSVNARFVKENASSVPHAVSHMKASRSLEPEKSTDISFLTDALQKQEGLSLDEAAMAVNAVKECGGSVAEAQKVAEHGGKVLGFGDEHLDRVAKGVR
ncbi:MAG: hypothetical protein Q9159_001333 [Coniocarpon cinnabarinum]